MAAVYFNPHGGEVFAVLDARDDEYEASLRESHVPFKVKMLAKATAALIGREVPHGA